MTPEALLDELRTRLGDEQGQAAWLILDELLSGERLYWPRRIGRALLARAVYEQRRGGRSDTAIMATLNLTRRQVQRLYRVERDRRITTRQDLPKTG